MAPKIRGLGFWAEPGQEDEPDVCGFVTAAPPDRETIAYLRSGTPFVWRATPWTCLLCGRPNGSAILTDGERYEWPEGLAHYLEDHGVRLPVRLRGRAGPVDAETYDNGVYGRQVTVDHTWWRAQSPAGDRDHLPGCPRSPVRRPWNLPRTADIWIDGVPTGDVATMARLRRLFGADWPFATLRDRIASQPFPVEPGGDPAALNRQPGLRDFLFYATPGGLLPVAVDG